VVSDYANFKKLDDTSRHVFLNPCFQKSPHGGHVHFLHKFQTFCTVITLNNMECYKI